ncbi:MAG TPA: Gfo/Idh/MocA family oxidoreductase [Opitutaceae bacterium]
MISLATVGISGYARTHLRVLETLHAAGRARLAAAVVINPSQEPEACARLQAEGVAILPDYETLLREWTNRIDAVCLPTPIHFHAGMTVAALRARWHVLVEKPLAATVSEVDAIIAARDQCDRFVGVGFQDISLPQAQWIKGLLTSGELGRVRAIKVGALWPRPAAYFRRNGWAGRVAVNGRVVNDSPLSNALAHFVNLALFWAGPRPDASGTPCGCRAELFRANDIENFDTASIRFVLQDGVEVLFLGSHASHEEREARIEVIAEHGRVEWINGAYVVVSRHGGAAETRPLPRPGRYVEPMWEAFLTRIAGGEAAIGTPEIARAHAMAVELAQASAPVRTVSPAWTEVAEEITGIRDMAGTFDAAWRAGALLSEVAAPWAGEAEKGVSNI